MGEKQRKKRIALYFKKTGVAVLVIALVLQLLPGILGSNLRSAEAAAVTTGDYIDLKQSTTELYQGDAWSGSSAAMGESGQKTKITVANFGTGGSNEWGIQYMLKNLGLKSNTKYQIEFDITSTIDKAVFIKLDGKDAGLIGEMINLKGNTTYHYSKESAAGTPSEDTQHLFFALGRTGSEANDLNGVITIENVKIEEVVEGNYIDVEKATTELYQGDAWSGSSASMSEDGQKTTITVANFGTGGSNEWGIQYMLKNLGLKSNTKYLVEFDITSTIDKNVFIKLDGKDAGLIGEMINLKGNTTYHYSNESTAGTPSADTQHLFFALGRTGSEANDLKGTITIKNVKVEEIKAAEIAKDITVNKRGTTIMFQLEKDSAIKTADVYYAISTSKDKANALNVGNAAFKKRAMSKKANGIWEVSEQVALKDGQIIRYYFEKNGVATIPVNYTASVFVAANYEYNNQSDLLAAGYTLEWADEFNGSDLDLSKWSFQIGTKDPNGGPDYWGNQEQEYYTDENHVVKDGKLIITAKQEDKEGMPYTSTRIRTKTDDGETLFATQYGRIEARMKLPTEEGLWPAFWMLPEDTTIYGTWAASGELDIMEARGRVPDKVGGTIHYGSQWPNNTYYGKEMTFDSTTDIGGYHVYSVEWEPGKITWLVDDVPYFSTSNFWSKDSGSSENYAYGAPFDVPFYLVFNLAVGGTFDGEANLENATFPAAMEVDYVRVYKKSDEYYQTLENNLTTPEADKDTASFNKKEYKPTGVNGDYVKDTAFTTLKAVNEVVPADSSWQFFVGDFGGKAAVAKDTIEGTTYAKGSITEGGSFNYAVQLIKHFPFAEGYTYEISFDAKASSNRDMLLKPCGDADNGWAGYGTSNTVSLTTTMSHYTHQFTMDKASDSTARLEFDLGLATGDVWIGNVVVKQVEPQKVDVSDNFKNPDQNGGNHIYNGSFDQGEGRLAFWHTEKATVKAPNVINPEFDAVTGNKGDFSHRASVTANDSDARIYQNGIWLQQSDIYKLSLNLSSEKATKVSAVLTNKDGSKVYMKQTFDVAGKNTRKDYTVNFAMSKGVTDKEAVFALVFEKGSTVSVDNIQLLRTTNNNVTVDYSDLVLEPVKTDTTGWVNNLNNGGTVTDTANENGVITSQTLTHQLNYMSMLYVPVTVKKGITYHLSFQAKSEFANAVMVNIQEDNTWAVTLEETLNMKAEEWQQFDFTINSTLTNDGTNKIFLKFLLSGPDVQPGSFMVKDVSMVAEVQDGAKDAPADTIVTSGDPIKGSDYTITLKDGEYKTKFLSYIDQPERKALVMVNGIALPDGNVVNDTIVIPASLIGAGAYTIELALDGYNNIVLAGTVKDSDGEIPKTGELPWTIYLAVMGLGISLAGLFLEKNRKLEK
ncbi:MAG: family 16 glycosylhydrolase [Mobilitalea sp.]